MACEDDAIVCAVKGMTPEAVLRRLIYATDEGCPAIGVKIETGDPCEPFITCDNADIDWQTLVAGMITVSDSDPECWLLRVIEQ